MTCEDKPRSQPIASEPVLLEPTPSASAPADVKIAHVQLRDLIVCPYDRGVVWYVGSNSIVEHDILDPLARPRVLARLTFTPVTLTTLPLPDNRILLAAGGQDRELFLALYQHDQPSTSPHATFSSPRPPSRSSSDASGSSVTLQDEWQRDGSPDVQKSEGQVQEHLELQRRGRGNGRSSREIWQHSNQFEYPASINNSVMLYIPPAPRSSDLKGAWPSPSLSRDNEMLPRLVVSNNDRSVKFLDISLTKGGFGRHVRESWFGRGNTIEERQYEVVGLLHLPVPVNHTTVSPDGSTLLSCGDSSSIYLHRIISKTTFDSSPLSPAYALDFEPLITLTLPPSPSYPTPLNNPYLPYAFVDGAWTLAGAPISSCFATAWNKDGNKFAVASQEGMVLVWDVRSGEPLQGGRWETVRVDDADEKGKGSMLSYPEMNGTWIRDADGAWMREGGPTVDDLGAWYGNRAVAPSWGVRVLKFAKNASGREVLVFTEHASKIHVIDADTFATHDVIRVPHVPLRKPLPPSPSPPALRIEDDPASRTTQPQEYAAQSFERDRRAFMSQFSAHERNLIHERGLMHQHRPWPARGHAGGYLSPRGYMNGGTRPMAIGGPRHTSSPANAPAPSRILSPGLPFSRSPEMMASEPSPRPRSVTLPPNVLQAFRSNGVPMPGTPTALNVLPPPPPPPRRRRHMPVIPAIPPGGLTSRRSSFESGRPARSTPAREARERRVAAAEARGAGGGGGGGANVEDSVMEEDIAWHMILDAIEREDVEMASEQERERDSQRDRESVRAALESARANATERLREAFFGRARPSVPSPPVSGSATQSRNSATDVERAEARFLEYLQSHRLQMDGESSTVVRLGSTSSDGSVSPGPAGSNSERPIPESWEDWDYECTTPPPPPLFSADLTRAASGGATASSSSEDAEMTTADSELSSSETVSLQSDIPGSHALVRRLPEDSDSGFSLSDADEARAPPAALPPFRELIEATDGRRLDIAGACFDRSGAYMYVATVDGITEWKVRGSELRWWGGGALI